MRRYSEEGKRFAVNRNLSRFRLSHAWASLHFRFPVRFMPAISQAVLSRAVLNAIQQSGFLGIPIRSPTHHPRRFAVSGQNTEAFSLSVYIWTLTFGGRKNLPNEYRIQMTSVSSPLNIPSDGPVVLLGYEPELKLFAGFDLGRHGTFSTGSPSVQLDREILKEAETGGLSFHRKSNDEIAIGIRPDQLVAYVLNAAALHRYGRESRVLRLLRRGTALDSIPETSLELLSPPRRRIVETIGRLSRNASFRRTVMFAYGNTCAVTRVQLELVDAAHILPVGAPGSPDHVTNGIALSPTYHRAFDAKLIYLDEDYRMQLNPLRTAELATLNLQSGIETFKAPLGKILLPPDKNQWPRVELIRKANKFRGIAK